MFTSIKIIMHEIEIPVNTAFRLHFGSVHHLILAEASMVQLMACLLTEWNFAWLRGTLLEPIVSLGFDVGVMVVRWKV